jgi:hypothetical protein
MLIETIEQSFGGISLAPYDPPIETWTDERVLESTQIELDEANDERLSDLLAAQREGELGPGEHSELAKLMRIYQQGLLLKARAIGEAVRRQLISPIDESYVDFEAN